MAVAVIGFRAACPGTPATCTSIRASSPVLLWCWGSGTLPRRRAMLRQCIGQRCVTVWDAVIAARQVLRALRQSIRSGGLGAPCLPAFQGRGVHVAWTDVLRDGLRR